MARGCARSEGWGVSSEAVAGARRPGRGQQCMCGTQGKQGLRGSRVEAITEGRGLGAWRVAWKLAQQAYCGYAYYAWLYFLWIQYTYYGRRRWQCNSKLTVAILTMAILTVAYCGYTHCGSIHYGHTY